MRRWNESEKKDKKEKVTKISYCKVINVLGLMMKVGSKLTFNTDKHMQSFPNKWCSWSKNTNLHFGNFRRQQEFWIACVIHFYGGCSPAWIIYLFNGIVFVIVHLWFFCGTCLWDVEVIIKCPSCKPSSK